MYLDREVFEHNLNSTYPILIGRGYFYYRHKWLKIFSSRDNLDLSWFKIWNHPSFNFWALIFGPYWFLYRKMYKIGIPWLFINSVLPTAILLDKTNATKLICCSIVPFIFYLASMLYGNTIYLRHVEGIVQKSTSSKYKNEILIRSGGTSFIFILLIPLVGIFKCIITPSKYKFETWNIVIPYWVDKQIIMDKIETNNLI